MIDQVQEVKERVDIVEVISTYLTLKKAGSNLKANCPFHSEKTPSLMVSPERQTFKCFGCGEGGDVITFIEKIEGLDFFNALKLLADRVGIQLKTQSIKFGDKEYRADKKTRIFEINELAKKVYHKILTKHPKAEKAREYLTLRGLKKETIEAFEIGYAPNSWDFILRFLKNKGYTESELVETGIAIKAEKGKVYDRFRGRIIFPINNIIGNTIAFTSRVLEDDGNLLGGGAKYINSAESPIYIKGKTIYGLDRAKLAIKEKDLAIVVEGNMDVIACHQAGFTNVVATSGTALTLDQLKVLNRYAGEIAFCFDSDNAGQSAMKRAVRMALQNDVFIKIITTSPFKDPDEAIKDNPKNWEKSIENAKPALEYWIDLLISNKEILEVNDKKKIAKEILPIIKTTYSDIEKEHYLKYLADKLSISEESLLEALQKTRKDKVFKKDADSNVKKEKVLSVLERIAGLIWAEPDLVNNIRTDSFRADSNDEKLSPLFLMINNKAIDRTKIKQEFALVYDQLSLAALKDIDPSNKEAFTKELQYLIGRYKSEQKESIKKEFARKIKQAESLGQKDELKKLLLEFSNLIK
jgi:DNA primase